MKAVLYESREDVGILRLNRPQSLNAFDAALLEELEEAIAAARVEEIRCLILTGAGKAFAAGADIGAMAKFTQAEALAFSRRGNRLFDQIEMFPRPVIAAVNGYALGGGFELALACDLRIASEKASFALPETGLGIFPGWGGVKRLCRLAGPGLAAEMIYTGRRLSAPEAVGLGIINQVFSPETLEEESLKLAQKISGKSPLGVQNAKEAIQIQLRRGGRTGEDTAERLFSQCFETTDQQNAMEAFAAGKPIPPFMGR